MEPFIVNSVIENVDYLFGRSKSINALISCAKRKENAGIIGARRFGKTCLLKSMLSYLELHSEINALPIYFDVKNDTNIHKNTPEVYYTLAALLAKKMCETGILQEGNYSIARRCTLDVSTDLSDMIVQMSSWHSEYQKKAFFNLTDKVCTHGKYVLLLLDEIDSLLLDALETPSDFGRIRSYATDKSEKLAFWIAGTSTWKSITTSIGSPELNCGLKQIRLSSLEKDDFSAMWKHECSLIENKELFQLLSSLEETIYLKTGGIPYYAKFIGSSFMNGTITAMPDYSILRDYLMEIYESRFMSEPEQSALKLLAKETKMFKDNVPDGISALYNKGLIEKSENEEYYIALQFLADYVNAIGANYIIETSPDIEKLEREKLVDEIMRLRNNVNKSYKENPPFLPSTEDPIEFNTLKIACHDEATIDAFAGSIYKLYYEGSELGQNLPEDFRDHTFSNMVRALRHLYNHRNCKPTSMTPEKLLALINHGKMPYKPEDYFCMQKNMLEAFNKELLDMMSKHPKETCTKKIGTTPKTVCGIFRKNTYGKKDYVEQESTGFRQEVRSIRVGEKLIDGDEVKYNLCSEPHTLEPSKQFWFAEDVHLKG